MLLLLILRNTPASTTPAGILQELKEKQIKAIAKWTDEKIKETYIKINGEYRDCEFTNNWLKSN